MDNTTAPIGTPQGIPTPPQRPVMPTEHRSIGPIIGTLIIVIVLVIGALYIWGQKLNNDDKNKASEPVTTEDYSSDQTAAGINGTFESEASLETDLETSLQDIDNVNF